MARQRMLHPDFFTDRKVLRCTPLARLLFQGLWCFADREGRVEADPLELKLRILPTDNCDVHELLMDLVRADLVALYDAAGRPVIQVLGFLKRQKPHFREAPSVLPPPPSDWKDRQRKLPTPQSPRLDPHSIPPEPSIPHIESPPSRAESESESVSKSESVAVRALPGQQQQPPTQNDWDGPEDFWNWFQALRRKAGCVRENPPDKDALRQFWAEAVGELDGDPEPLREAVFRYGDDPYWQKKTPPCPFMGFVRNWPKYTPRGAVAHDA